MTTSKNRLLSITELPNELTRNIDMAGPLGIVRMLRQSDAQIAVGYNSYPALLDREILERIEQCIRTLADMLQTAKNPCVIISGAGTSGRLSTVICRELNRQLDQVGRPAIFRPIMAGGHPALIKAKEGAEDDPIMGMKELEQLSRDADRVLYIGVTCGFSAPYIAGQLDYCMQNEKFTGILLGYNPVERARDIEVENWDKTVLQVARAMEKHPRASFLNPVVGPEPITGSTRMKGGTATKMLLEAALAPALVLAGWIDQKDCTITMDSDNLRQSIIQLLESYEKARVKTYLQAENLAKLVEMGGEALRNRGHIYYLGRDTAGILGLIDASECPPTFGAEFEDVRGFLDGGWDTLLGQDQREDLSQIGWEYRITFEEFAQKVMPQLSENDLVVALVVNLELGSIKKLLEETCQGPARTCLLSTGSHNPETVEGLDLKIHIDLDPAGIFPGNKAFAEMAMKLAINALTTGAHVLSGKVYENRMIDLKISNNKLFFRTLGIIQHLMGVDEETARSGLIRSIFGVDQPTEEQKNAKISDYVNKATGARKIVPRALLLTTGQMNVEQATRRLEENPAVRPIVEEFTASSSEE
jgi:N-acetylmuramic acid 6-phosphate (MurNAc-6-P) etherase